MADKTKKRSREGNTSHSVVASSKAVESFMRLDPSLARQTLIVRALVLPRQKHGPPIISLFILRLDSVEKNSDYSAFAVNNRTLPRPGVTPSSSRNSPIHDLLLTRWDGHNRISPVHIYHVEKRSICMELVSTNLESIGSCVQRTL
jgi:hypothetical protein